MIVSRAIDPVRLARFLGLPLLLLVVYGAAITLLHQGGQRWVAVNDLPLSLLGTAIALIVTFRNNAAYDRWWEARGLWGLTVNNSRSFARGVLTFVDDPVLRARLVRLQIAHALALRSALLEQAPWPDIVGHVPGPSLPVLRNSANVPAAIQGVIAQELAAARRRGELDTIAAASLDATLLALANAQGGLERIKRTPLPRQYNQFPKVFVGLYCALLPVGLVGDLGLFTAIVAPTIGFMFLSLDRIGHDLEDPFANSLHDIPMRAITRTIEIDLLQLVGVHDVPKAVAPVDGVLW